VVLWSVASGQVQHYHERSAGPNYSLFGTYVLDGILILQHVSCRFPTSTHEEGNPAMAIPLGDLGLSGMEALDMFSRSTDKPITGHACTESKVFQQNSFCHHAPTLKGSTKFDALPNVKNIMVTGGAGFMLVYSRCYVPLLAK
jgi:hypothetical protein